MSKIFIVGDEITVTGLKLAGLKDAHIATAQNVETVLEQKGEAEIIVITHSLYSAARKKIDQMKENIVVEIPDAQGGGEDVVNKIIRDVIGFEITKG